MVDQIKLYTVAELEALPDDGTRRELIEGELIEMPGPKPNHNIIGFLIAKLIDLYVTHNHVGIVIPELGCQLIRDPDTLVFPDVGYVSFARLGDHKMDEYIPFAPDLAIEIVSPSNSNEDISRKTALYLKHGARLVWVIYPKPKHVYVYRADSIYQIVEAAGTLNGGDVLPGFELKLTNIFQNS